MRRIVFDTTVLISAFLRPGGLSDELLGLAALGDFELLLAEPIIAETRNKLLTSSRLRSRYGYSDAAATRFCRALGPLGEIVRDLPSLAGVVRDPDDDVILACAIKGQADGVITRDKDLLSLGSYQGIAIVTPETFRQQLRAARPRGRST
jgi:putative PIN family toxin of toxin-antitoxin system